MKLLLMVTAVVEALVGLGLFLIPAVVVSNFLNTSLDTTGGIIVARLAGAAICALALCCWQARSSERLGAGLGVVSAMLFYNVSAVVVLVYGGIRLGVQSVFVWPTIVLHSILALWCAVIVWLAKQKQLESASTES